MHAFVLLRFRYVLPFLGCLLLSTSLLAQENFTDQIIWLDGRSEKVKVLEFQPGAFVVFETSEGGEKRVAARAFDRLIMGVEDRRKKIPKPKTSALMRGAFGAVGPALYLGQDQNDDPILRLVIDGYGGYQFSRFIGVVGGLHLLNYDLDANLRIMSLTAGYQVLLTEHLPGVFAQMNVGYGIPVGNSDDYLSAKGGLVFNPVIGIRLGKKAQRTQSIEVGYRLQYADYTTLTFQDDLVRRDALFRRFFIRTTLTLWKN